MDKNEHPYQYYAFQFIECLIHAKLLNYILLLNPHPDLVKYISLLPFANEESKVWES